MIIDAHAHVFAWPKIIVEYSGATFMSMQDQIAMMDETGIDKAVILPVNNAETPAEFQSIGEVLYICDQYPGRFIPFCNIDPRLMYNPDRIEKKHYLYLLEQYREMGCKGLGELIARMWWDDPLVLMLLEACSDLGFAVTFHTTFPDGEYYGLIDDVGFPRFSKVLEMFPDLKFFAHSQAWWSEIGGNTTADKVYPEGPVKPGGIIKKLMRQYPNLYGDLSANSGLNALTRDPEHAYEFIDEFQDQLLFGQDYCAVDNDMQHLQWLTTARDQKHITEEAYQKIMWKNVNRALGLGFK